jgi:hypothetical protein
LGNVFREQNAAQDGSRGEANLRAIKGSGGTTKIEANGRADDGTSTS